VDATAGAQILPQGAQQTPYAGGCKNIEKTFDSTGRRHFFSLAGTGLGSMRSLTPGKPINTI
jgi:hypothetical protein